MSDTQQGSDWWLASDGRWYPPTSTPGWIGDVPPPSRTLGIWLQVLLWLSGLLGITLAVTSINSYLTLQDWETEPSEAHLTSWLDANDLATQAAGLSALFSLVALVLIMVWMNTAHKHLGSLDPGERKWSSGWTVGGWFIPVANFVIPKLVLNEIDRIARSPRMDDGAADPNWRGTKVSPIGYLYWLGWVAGSIGVGVSTAQWDGVVDATSAVEMSISDALASYQWQTVGGFGLALAGIFGVFYFRKLTKIMLGD